MGGFTGQVVVVTGASEGIGRAFCLALAPQQPRLVLAARNRERLESLAAQCGALGAQTLVVPTDVTDEPACRALINAAVARFGRLDVLVNNASTFYATPFGEIDEAAWEDLLGTNLKAPLFLSQAAAPALRTARGLIVNLADIHGRRPLRRHTTYSIAKAGLVMLTRSLARELAPEVRVNAIAPGPVMWPVGGADDTLKAEIAARTALKRMGSPHDVALAARYFAVDAPFVTGQILAVDGGRSLGG